VRGVGECGLCEPWGGYIGFGGEGTAELCRLVSEVLKSSQVKSHIGLGSESTAELCRLVSEVLKSSQVKSHIGLGGESTAELCRLVSEVLVDATEALSHLRHIWDEAAQLG
jgi:nitrogenase molybdenum-iron protein alpha/beta subunit